MAESGSVAWKFERRGVMSVPKKYSEDELMEIVLDAGADDMSTEEDSFEIYTTPSGFPAARAALEAKSIEIAAAAIQLIPKSTLKVEGREAEAVLRLVEALEEHDDVQNVYADFDIDATVMESLG
jgi:transcriptional/translational regulatory protein YebC/TACO1